MFLSHTFADLNPEFAFIPTTTQTALIPPHWHHYPSFRQSSSSDFPMFRTHLIWQPGKLYISQYGRFFQIKLSSASPKMDHHPQQDQNAKDKMCEILIEFKAGFTNPCAHLPFQCSSNVRRWRWMKFSRALKEFGEGEIFWEAEGPTNHPGRQGGAGRH